MKRRTKTDAARRARLNSARCAGMGDGGYILLYVVIVIITLCILATGVCTSAMHNLTMQRRAVDDMKRRYDAEGIAERFVAELETAAKSASYMTGQLGEESRPEDSLSTAAGSMMADAVNQALDNVKQDLAEEGQSLSLWDSRSGEVTDVLNDALFLVPNAAADEDDASGAGGTTGAGGAAVGMTVSYHLAISAESDGALVRPEMIVSLSITSTKRTEGGGTDTNGEPTPVTVQYTYRIDRVVLTYDSYLITTAPDGGEGGGA